jgi:hypothetical protein
MFGFSLLIRCSGGEPAGCAACGPAESEPMSNKGNMVVVIVVGVVALGLLFGALQLG